MAKNTYSAKYRAPGRMLWEKFKAIKGDGFLAEGCRYFLTDDDEIVHFPRESEVRFGAERSDVIQRQMSREAGQPVQMVDR